MKTVTVFTPTYNRMHTLQRAFESLMRQTSKDFEWLIIDDGSTDETWKLVESFRQIADFEIRYFWKENGGRHTAVNYSYQYLRTKYVVTLDSDDELTPNAIQRMIEIWDSILKEDYERFWCISGREVNASTGMMIGEKYPEGINKLTGRKQRKVILKYRGEKHCCRKVDVHKQYLFPEYPGIKFISENIVWEKINRKYDQFCVNDIFGKYYVNSSDSLGRGKIHHTSRYLSFFYVGLFYVNDLFDELFFNRDVLFFSINISRCALLCGIRYFELMNLINRWYKKIFVTLGYPISFLWILFHKRHLFKKEI